MYMNKIKWKKDSLREVILLSVLAILLFAPDPAYAATNVFGQNETEQLLAAGTGITGFDNTFTKFASGMVQIAKPLVCIMTAIAGCMVVLGIQDSTKTVWNIILGVGLALNFGGFIAAAFVVEPGSTANVVYYDMTIKQSGNIDILSGFMNNYTANIIVPGAEAIKGIAQKLLLILLLIEATLQLSLDLISGDKVKYLITVSLKAGFYMFLIQNWIGGSFNLMTNLSDGFQEIGFLAGGDSAGVLKPDSIVNNAVTIFSAIWSSAKGEFSVNNLGVTFVDLIALIVIVICLFLTAIEMFMARIEFYTMALITIPLLPFGVCKQTEFLSQKAIGAMFNCAIKVSVIAFITAFALPMMQGYADQMKALSSQSTSFTDALFNQIAVILQMVLAAVIIYFITKKIPELVQSVLSGTPSLNGGGMTQMGMSAAKTAAAGAGAVGAAAGAAGGMSKIAQGAKSGFASATGGAAMSQMGAAGIMKGIGGALTGGAGAALSVGAGTAKNLGIAGGKGLAKAATMGDSRRKGSEAVLQKLGMSEAQKSEQQQQEMYQKVDKIFQETFKK